MNVERIDRLTPETGNVTRAI